MFRADRGPFGCVATYMSITFWLSFLFTTSPAPHAPAPHAACATTGTPLFEMREGNDRNPNATTTTSIFNSGAWEIEKNGVATEHGCFGRKELRSIRQAVQSAPWKVTDSPVACFAYDPHFTQYLVHGHVRFTARMCSGKTADSETLDAIALVKADLAADLPSPPPPVAKPPVAKP